MIPPCLLRFALRRFLRPTLVAIATVTGLVGPSVTPAAAQLAPPPQNGGFASDFQPPRNGSYEGPGPVQYPLGPGRVIARNVEIRWPSTSEPSPGVGLTSEV